MASQQKEEEEQKIAFKAELRDFNCGDLNKLDLKEESEEKKANGETDVGSPDEICDVVSVSRAGQDKKGSSKAPTVTTDK